MTDSMSRDPAVGGQPEGKAAAAKEVAGKTASRAGEVAGEAQTQAKVVAREAKDHVRDLMERGRSDLGGEATARSQQAAGTIRTLADRAGALANGDPEGAGPLADILREGQDRLQTLASRLDDGPQAVLDDVRNFARRQPVLFLASAGALGFLAGRLVRAGRDAQSSSGGSTDPGLYGSAGSVDTLAMPVGAAPAAGTPDFPAPTPLTTPPIADVVP
jgi:ElaB/YqjD/DUF883 family membrane-anchored ribosome-binding protein